MDALRKDVLPFRKISTNLGLQLDKLNRGIDKPDNNETNNHNHIERDKMLTCMESFKMSKEAKNVYRYSYDNWVETMQNRKDTECFEIKSITKILLGTGNASVFEFGVNLSKPHGVPIISGSSLKGLVSAYLAKNGSDEWFKSSKTTEKSLYQVQLFGGRYGKSDYVGSVNFYDAKISPSENHWFVKDIVTTHHQKYYGDNEQIHFPDGTENPVPIKISALNSELTFFVVLQGPDKDRKFVKKVLLEALRNDGIGGKTAVGYGRFEYILSKNEKIEMIKSYSIEELKTLPKGDSLGKDETYDNAVRFALENNNIDGDLFGKYKKYAPLRYIRMKINDKADISLKEIKLLEKEVRKSLGHYPSLKSGPDSKFIFDFALSTFDLTTAQIAENRLLKQIAYSWDDVELTTKNIVDVICNLGNRIWPSANDLKKWLDNSTLENKIDALELLEMEMEELTE